MGAASVDVPALMVTGGPMLSGRFRNEPVGACTDCWRLHDELRAERITQDDWDEFEAGMCRSDGHCSPMGTASTMACLTEALGMAPAGSAAIPAVDSRRRHVAERAGVQIMDLVVAGTRPSDIMTRHAFENAIRTLHAIGGSTNAVIHLLAIAGRQGVDLPLDLFDELAGTTPLLANLKPSGAYLMEDFFYAGGLPAVHAQIADLLHLDALTVTGRTVGESILGARIVNDDVIRTRDSAILEGGSLAILRGSLCPDGAVLKVSAASPLLQHEGRAVVFGSVDELHATIDDPALDITGPTTSSCSRTPGRSARRACRSPATSRCPPTSAQGVTDMVRISDARMSGAGFGTVVLHVARSRRSVGRSPSSGRAIASGWTPTAGASTCSSAPRMVAERRAAWVPRPPGDDRGYRGLYRPDRHAGQRGLRPGLPGRRVSAGPGPGSRTGERPRGCDIGTGWVLQAQPATGSRVVPSPARQLRVMRDDRLEHLSVRADAVLEEVRPLPAVAGRDAQAGLERRPERGDPLDEVIVVCRRDEQRVVADVGVEYVASSWALAIASNDARIAASSSGVARSAASHATASSMILRTSNMPRRNSGSRPASVSQASTSGSSRRHSERGRITVPRLDRDSTRPFAARTLVASRITVRLTPSMRLSSPCSGRSRPERARRGRCVAQFPAPRRHGSPPAAGRSPRIHWCDTYYCMLLHLGDAGPRAGASREPLAPFVPVAPALDR